MVKPLRSASKSLLSRKYESKHVLAAAFIVLCINAAYCFYNEYALGLGYPYSTFLFNPEDRFADFFKVIDAFHIADTWGEGNPYDLMYKFYAMPFSTLYYYSFALLIRLVGSGILVYGLLNLVLAAWHWWYCRRNGNPNGAIVLSLLSYPVLYAIDRGNFAILVYLLVFTALTTSRDTVAMIMLAAATALKITPVIFIIATLLKRPVTFRRILATGAIFTSSLVAILVGSVLIIKWQLTDAPFTLTEFSEMAKYYNDAYVSEFRGLSYGSSAYEALLYIFHKSGLLASVQFFFKPITVPLFCAFAVVVGLHFRSKLPSPYRVFLIFAFLFIELAAIISLHLPPTLILVLFAGSLFTIWNLESLDSTMGFSCVIEKIAAYINFEKAVFITSISFVLFSPVTGDYYLLFMLIPLLMFPKATYSLGYVVVYGLLLGAKNIGYFPDTVGGNPLSPQPFLNPLLLTMMFFAEFDLFAWMKRTQQTLPESVTSLHAHDLVGMLIQKRRSLDA